MFRNIYKLIILLGLVANFSGKMSFTNLVCNNTDKTFANFEYCYFKAVNRSFQYLSLKVNLFKVPINNVTIRVNVMKRLNGYKPFLYDVTFDACNFMKKRRKNPLLSYFYMFIEENSNLNHTCPYNHDVIVEKISNARVDYLVTEHLPVPRGDYGVFTSWWAYNTLRANVNIYATLT